MFILHIYSSIVFVKLISMFVIANHFLNLFYLQNNYDKQHSVGLREAFVDIGKYLLYLRGLYNNHHVSMVDCTGCMEGYQCVICIDCQYSICIYVFNLLIQSLCVDNQMKILIHASTLLPESYLYYGTQKFSIAYTLIIVIYVLGIFLYV